MSIFKTLAKEHEVFSRLIDRVERCARYDPETARQELRGTLLVLLPALDRHEEIEVLVFGTQLFASHGAARGILALVEGQHAKIEALRREMLDDLELSEGTPVSRLKARALELGKRLRAHFATEEKRLWPRYHALMGRSLDRSLDRRVLKRVADLEREVKAGWVMIADYLRGGA